MTSQVPDTSTQKRMMVDPMDDIARQARQGSVSAVIQVLNEKLADSGIRTRAMFEQGVLQLLCEAPKAEQLDRPQLVPEVKKILESLQPRNIRRVNINSRIVREQQLLWLEEINRDPEGQLLWSEEITLAQPGFFQRLRQDRRDEKNTPKANAPMGSPVRVAREKKVFWRGLVGGASLSLFLLLSGWALLSWLLPKFAQFAQQSGQPSGQQSGQSDAIANKPTASANSAATSPANPTAATAATATAPNAPGQSDAKPAPAAPNVLPTVAQPEDSFTLAVRLAEESARLGKTANTKADWLDLAARWQRASDLMNEVKSDSKHYTVAQDRVKQYRQNSEAAAQNANQNANQ
jgi:hypothetical protein